MNYLAKSRNTLKVIKTFDNNGNVLTQTDRLGQTISMTYESSHNMMTQMVDRNNHKTTWTYDSNGNKLSMTDALNETTQWTYDSFGEMKTMTDPLGHTWTMGYDTQGNMTSKTDPLGNTSTMGYDGIGRITSMADPLGRTTTVTYDKLSRVLTKNDPAQATTTFVYDQNGNQTTIIDALGRTWTMQYDAKNRITAKIYPLPQNAPAGTQPRIMQMQYNADDELTATIFPFGRTTIYDYDPRGQRKLMKDPVGGTITFTYDINRNLQTLTDQRNNTTIFGYDDLYRVTKITDPIGQFTTMGYDPEGNQISMVDRLGRNTTIIYDPLDRVNKIVYADATVIYTYDAGGRRTRIDDTQSGSIVWTYDNGNRILSETTSAGIVSYTYNTASERATMTATDRPQVIYGYDSAGRLQTIQQGTEIFTYGYDILSRRTSLQRPNGVLSTYSYDEVNRLIELKHQIGTNSPIEDFKYTFDPDDEIASINSLFSAPKSAVTQTGSAADSTNRIQQFGSASFGFDTMGQTISKTDANGASNYIWDARGRLIKITLPNNQAVSYGYDALNRRISRTTTNLITQFLYDRDDIVLDMNSDGSKVDYLNSLFMDEKLRQSSAVSGLLYFIQDHLKTTVALTSTTGNVVERNQYEVFGESAGSALTRYGYTGREQDPLTGLIYYRARWYDPQQRRFLNEDHIGFSGGLNFYSYVKNNPLIFTDPFGLQAQACCCDPAELEKERGRIKDAAGGTIDKTTGNITGINTSFNTIVGDATNWGYTPFEITDINIHHWGGDDYKRKAPGCGWYHLTIGRPGSNPGFGGLNAPWIQLHCDPHKPDTGEHFWEDYLPSWFPPRDWPNWIIQDNNGLPFG